MLSNYKLDKVALLQGPDFYFHFMLHKSTFQPPCPKFFIGRWPPEADAQADSGQ